MRAAKLSKPNVWVHVEWSSVHVIGPAQAKVNLPGTGDPPELVWSTGIKRSDLRRLMTEAAKHRDAFKKEWERIHGRTE